MQLSESEGIVDGKTNILVGIYKSEEFVLLQEATEIFSTQAGDKNLSEQMSYWLKCWADTTESAISYLAGIKADLSNDTTGILNYQAEGKAAFNRSKTYEFWYVDHNERAEVGVQHIVPFIELLDSYLSNKAEIILNPEAIQKSFITNRSDAPVASTSLALDGDDATIVSYRNPVWIYEGDYIGMLLNKKTNINYIRFLLGNEKNHMEFAKVQYTKDGEKQK